MGKASIWKSSPEYQVAVSRFCSLDGLEPPKVATVIFSQERLQKAFPKQAKLIGDIPAFSIGGKIPPVSIGGMRLIRGNCPVGLIAFEERIENTFDADEREYILAHEYGHIVRNHCPLKYLGSVGSDLVKDYVSRLQDKTMRKVLSLAWQSIEMMTSAGFTKQSEINADADALRLAGSREVASRTIRKLADEFAGGDLTQPTHYISSNKQRLPVLSYQERLNAIESAF